MQYDEERVTSAAENIIQACERYVTNTVYVGSAGNTIFINSKAKGSFRLLEDTPEFVRKVIVKIFQQFDVVAPAELENKYITLPFEFEDSINTLVSASTSCLQNLRNDCYRTLHSFKRRLYCIDEVLKSRKKEPKPVEDLFPILKQGYVAMNKDCIWYWFENSPELQSLGVWQDPEQGKVCSLSCFCLLSVDDYKTSKRCID